MDSRGHSVQNPFSPTEVGNKSAVSISWGNYPSTSFGVQVGQSNYMQDWQFLLSSCSFIDLSQRSIKYQSIFLSVSIYFWTPSPDVCVSLPRDIQHESLKGVHSHWRHSFSFVNNHYLFLACFLIVLLSIMLYLLRLRRIHRRTAQRCSPSSVPWLEEGLGSPTLPINL